MTKEVDKIFARQPLDPRGGLDPLRPPRPWGYFRVPMMNMNIPPLPPNKPYCRPPNYLEYVKDFDPNAQIKVFKVAFRSIVFD